MAGLWDMWSLSKVLNPHLLQGLADPVLTKMYVALDKRVSSINACKADRSLGEMDVSGTLASTFK